MTPVGESAKDVLQELRQKLEAQIDEWEGVQAHMNALLGQGYVVFDGEGLALRVKQFGEAGVETTPVHVHPGLPNITHLTKEDAVQVAANRGSPYQAVHAREVPALRLAALKNLRDKLKS